jgi:Ca2+-binding RTX toxin-like protein
MRTIRGTNNADQLTGNAMDNLIFGRAGDDFINGLGGNDRINGDEGNDRILGGMGDDQLSGGTGEDAIAAEAGDDTVFGEVGSDRIDGGEGNDRLFGGADNDTLDGNNGNDFLDGGDGDDAMRGGAGADQLRGGLGNDVLLGEAGDDVLNGGAGDDVLDGDRLLRLFGVTDQNTLVSFDPNRLDVVRSQTVTGIDGNLLGIDVRPADGQLYGITDTNKIYQINDRTGAATFVSTLNVPFTGGKLSGVDFNPVPDRFRVVGANDQNFRINVDTGAVADFDANTPGVQPDRPLAYAQGDVNFGKNPNIVANAYTNSFSPSPDPNRRTTLYAIDSELDVLVRQGGLDGPPSPNEGQLFTVGKLGVDFSANSGFDILSAPNGQNVAIASSGAKLYQINLQTGSATELGTIGNGRAQLVGLAVNGVTDPNSRGKDRLYGGEGNDVLTGGGGEDRLNGKAGNDTLSGGADDDLLTGGEGIDSFVFSSITPFSSANLGRDRLQDFTSGVDKIVLDQTTFGALTATQIAIVGNDRQADTSAGMIVYSQASGSLFFNQNGAIGGLGSGGKFAQLENRATVTASDFVIVA